MLTVELKKAGESNKPDELEMFMDMEGLRDLMAQLQLLLQKRTDHVHLMSKSWGGTHLDDVPHAPNNTVIHHMKIYLR